MCAIASTFSLSFRAEVTRREMTPVLEFFLFCTLVANKGSCRAGSVKIFSVGEMTENDSVEQLAYIHRASVKT